MEQSWEWIVFRKQSWILLWILLAASQTGLAEGVRPEPNSALPPLIVGFHGNAVRDVSLGLVASGLLALRDANAAGDQKKLSLLLTDLNSPERVSEFLGCLAVSDVQAGCRRVAVLNGPAYSSAAVPTKELSALLSAVQNDRAYVLEFEERFDGRWYSLVAWLRDVQVQPSVAMGREVMARWESMYSKRLDAESRNLDPNDRAAKPALGSKTAREQFWLNGEPSRLESDMKASRKEMKDLLEVVLATPPGQTTTSAPDQYRNLPKLSVLRKAGTASCANPYCQYRVNRETRDRLYLEPVNMPMLISIPRWGVE